MSSNSRSNQTSQLLVLGLAVVAAGAVAWYLSTQQSVKKKALHDDDDGLKKPGMHVRTASDATLPTTNATATRPTMSAAEEEATEKKLGDPKKDDKALHAQIESLDKKGKAFFKNKQYLEAAQAFTEALLLIEAETDHSDPSSSTSLNKQIITLINNRSAMYEKGSFPELALEDCNKILEVYDLGHTKARLRKLRILEHFENWYGALVEVCALQLMYMQQNRDQLRMGLPPKTQPPVPQSKLEELVAKILPDQLEEYSRKVMAKQKDMLPSDYTLEQLLKSYTGFNAWKAKAANDGTITMLEGDLKSIVQSDDPASLADQASIGMRMGRRYVYDGEYAKARKKLLATHDLVKNSKDAQVVMKDDDYARLLEWVGMVKHWSYDLSGATACYQEVSQLEPINSEIMVKQAGVAMDGAKHEEALALFEKALSMDPDAVDALLHRANLRMLQANLSEAQVDLEHCLKIRPNHVLARLRLAAVLTSKNESQAAEKQLEMAEQSDPQSSEVQSYHGELMFTKGEFAEAKAQFEKAIKLEPKNPTPYVNAALAVLNTQPEPSKQLEMAREACSFLERAVEADPQFQAAYVQLGQLKLGMATDLASARDVLKLYEQGLSYCRTKEEMKDLCSMKLLTQAQVDAATSLKMETFSMQ